MAHDLLLLRAQGIQRLQSGCVACRKNAGNETNEHSQHFRKECVLQGWVHGQRRHEDLDGRCEPKTEGKSCETSYGG